MILLFHILLIAETMRADSGDNPHQVWIACLTGQPLQIRHVCGYLQALALPADKHVKQVGSTISIATPISNHCRQGDLLTLYTPPYTVIKMWTPIKRQLSSENVLSRAKAGEQSE